MGAKVGILEEPNINLYLRAILLVGRSMLNARRVYRIKITIVRNGRLPKGVSAQMFPIDNLLSFKAPPFPATQSQNGHHTSGPAVFHYTMITKQRSRTKGHM